MKWKENKTPSWHLLALAVLSLIVFMLAEKTATQVKQPRYKTKIRAAQTTLAALLKGRDSQCSVQLVKDIAALEAHAAKGCKASAAKLVAFEARLPQPKAVKVTATQKSCGTCPASTATQATKVVTPVKVSLTTKTSAPRAKT